MKLCPACQKRKPKSEFYKNRSTADGLTCYCRKCTYQKTLVWQAANPEKVKAIAARTRSKNRQYHRDRSKAWYRANKAYCKKKRRAACLKQYGLTPKEFDKKLAEQGGTCAICTGPPANRWNRYAVDHDHETGKNRGLLCARCNLAIGQLQENEDIMKKCIEYLRLHGKKF